MPRRHGYRISTPSKMDPDPNLSENQDIEASANADSSSESSSLNFSVPSAGELERTVLSTLGWWKEEYLYCGACLAAAAGLVALMALYDGQPEPDWENANHLRLSTVVVAVMTGFRLALKAVIETHLACVGAFITILAQGFETFSSQMVEFNEEPTPYIDKSSMSTLPAPPLPRAETWHNVVPRGISGDMSVGLSTKAAIYDGIIAGTMSTVPVSCSTANCTWPPFPTLAVCGNCSESLFRTSCDLESGCTYTMPSGTSISHPNSNTGSEFHFTVSPSNGSAANVFSSADSQQQAYFSVFDMMSVSSTTSSFSSFHSSPAKTRIRAYECALWFCLQALNVSVTNGVQSSTTLATWSKTAFSGETSAHFDELAFVDVPEDQLYVRNHTRYAVRADALGALNSFMDSLTLGNASEVAAAASGTLVYSSDFVEAMQNATSDLDAWIGRLALSMTNDVRLSGDAPDAARTLEYSGTAYIMASHVRVNWYWVVYPLALMLLAFCYLAQTVWRTARDQVCAWKADSLPLLFCRVQQSIRTRIGDAMNVPEGLNDRVGRTEVELVRRPDGQWLFREPVNH
ncbi:hypothetical protein AAE478_009424 [Parahypoxylon ruwenzoriense]